MFGRIVLVLLLVFIASTCGMMAIVFGSKQTPESLEKINKDQEDPTTLPGCLTLVCILSFGALVLLGLMWFVYGFLGANPKDTPSLPWTVSRSRQA